MKSPELPRRIAQTAGLAAILLAGGAGGADVARDVTTAHIAPTSTELVQEAKGAMQQVLVEFAPPQITQTTEAEGIQSVEKEMVPVRIEVINANKIIRIDEVNNQRVNDPNLNNPLNLPGVPVLHDTTNKPYQGEDDWRCISGAAAAQESMKGIGYRETREDSLTYSVFNPDGTPVIGEQGIVTNTAYVVSFDNQPTPWLMIPANVQEVEHHGITPRRSSN